MNIKPATKTLYVTNKDLMEEINKSKLSFCSFTDDRYTTWDVSVKSLDEITPELIEEARRVRADRINFDARAGLRAKGIATTNVNNHYTRLEVEDVRDEDLVFRMNTWDHVPMDPEAVETHAARMVEYEKRIAIFNAGLSRARLAPEKPAELNEAKSRAEVNFTPFEHYTIISGRPVLVGRSHWTGSFENGHFNQDQGRITNRLGRMMMKLVERYSQRGNWRGYSYNDEMRGQALLQLTRGALKFDETRGSNPFAYFTVVTDNAFKRVLNLEKRGHLLRDDLLEMAGVNPSITRQIRNQGC